MEIPNQLKICNRLVNGYCSSTNCLLRGNKVEHLKDIPKPIDFSRASCEVWEYFKYVEELENKIK